MQTNPKALVAAALLATVGMAQAGTAYVTSEKDDALTLIDTATLAVKGTIKSCKRTRHIQRMPGWADIGWLTADRGLALESLQRVSTRATVHEGGRREAILFAVTANQRHGLRRTAEDKRRAVSTLLDDPDWWKLGEMEIARLCGVSRTLVQELLEPKRGKEPPSAKRKRRKAGKSASDKEKASSKKATPEGGDMSEKTDTPPGVVEPPSVDAKGTELGSDWLREVFAAAGEFDALRKDRHPVSAGSRHAHPRSADGFAFWTYSLQIQTLIPCQFRDASGITLLQIPG